MPTKEVTPMAAAVVLNSWSARPVRKPCASEIRPSASTEKPNSLGSCPMTMVRARPFM